MDSNSLLEDPIERYVDVLETLQPVVEEPGNALAERQIEVVARRAIGSARENREDGCTVCGQYCSSSLEASFATPGISPDGRVTTRYYSLSIFPDPADAKRVTYPACKCSSPPLLIPWPRQPQVESSCQAIDGGKNQAGVGLRSWAQPPGWATKQPASLISGSKSSKLQSSQCN